MRVLDPSRPGGSGLPVGSDPSHCCGAADAARRVDSDVRAIGGASACGVISTTAAVTLLSS